MTVRPYLVLRLIYLLVSIRLHNLYKGKTSRLERSQPNYFDTSTCKTGKLITANVESFTICGAGILILFYHEFFFSVFERASGLMTECRRRDKKNSANKSNLFYINIYCGLYKTLVRVIIKSQVIIGLAEMMQWNMILSLPVSLLTCLTFKTPCKIKGSELMCLCFMLSSLHKNHS